MYWHYERYKYYTILGLIFITAFYLIMEIAEPGYINREIFCTLCVDPTRAYITISDNSVSKVKTVVLNYIPGNFYEVKRIISEDSAELRYEDDEGRYFEIIGGPAVTVNSAEMEYRGEGNVFLWQIGGISFRLEGSIPREDLLDIVEHTAVK